MFEDAKAEIASFLKATRDLLLLIVGVSAVPSLVIFFTSYGPAYPSDKQLTIGISVTAIGLAAILAYVVGTNCRARNSVVSCTTVCAAAGGLGVVAFLISLLFYIDGGGA